MTTDKKVICYVDDEKDEIRRFRKNMESYYIVAAGVSLNEAVAQLGGRRPDLFLLDLYHGKRASPKEREAIREADQRVTAAEDEIRALMNRAGLTPNEGYALANEVDKRFPGIPRAFFSRKAFLEDALRAFDLGVPLLEKPDPDPRTPGETYDQAFEKHADHIDRRIQRLMGVPATGIRVFISHASADAALAKKLIDLIEAGLEAPDGTIRCTSVDGYKLHAGDDAPETLRGNLQECSVVIGLLTEASVTSSYVLMELGAAWAFKKTAILLLHGVAFDQLPGPFKDVHALRLDNQPDLAELINTISKHAWLMRRSNEPKYIASMNELAKHIATRSAPR